MQIHEVCNDSAKQKNAYCAGELLGGENGCHVVILDIPAWPSRWYLHAHQKLRQPTASVSFRQSYAPDICKHFFPKAVLVCSFALWMWSSAQPHKTLSALQSDSGQGPFSLLCSGSISSVTVGKTSELLGFQFMWYIAYYPKKKELLGCTDEVCLLTFFLMYLLWEQSTTLAQKMKKDGGSKWARTGVRCCWSPQRAGQDRESPEKLEVCSMSVDQEPQKGRNVCSEVQTKAKPLRSWKGADIPRDPEELSNPRNHWP